MSYASKVQAVPTESMLAVVKINEVMNTIMSVIVAQNSLDDIDLYKR